MTNVFLLPLLLLAAATQPTTKPTVSTDRADGIYAAGHEIAFTVKAENLPEAKYVLRRNGVEKVAEGTLSFIDGKATVQTTTDAPGWMALQVTAQRPGEEKPTEIRGGAIVDWQKIGLSKPAPDDFDQFWKDQLAESDKLPLNPKLTEKDSGEEGVVYYTFEFDNIAGKKVRGQYAKPKREGKFPASIILPWAGVYGFPKSNVVNLARQGWIAINVMAHDIPSDEPPEFYMDQGAGPLKAYTAIGNTSRETSYFRPMIVGCYRAATWLGEQPEWDGKTYFVQGTSQGGMLSIIIASLYPKATAMSVNVPAGCDTNAVENKRMHGWPGWKGSAEVMTASRYFDPCNFASKVNVPCLVSVGLVDLTCPPTAVISAFNEIKSERKELLIMPLSDHQGTGGTQKAYYDRHAEWLQLLQKTGAPPAK